MRRSGGALCWTLLLVGTLALSALSSGAPLDVRIEGLAFESGATVALDVVVAPDAACAGTGASVSRL
ncbi:MAG: hypothetical protein AB1778_00165, partial [Candidatus Bipolaricaulota bacterium]